MLWHQASATDLLFITLRKSEALFSPSTRYRDLALGPSLFHWENQSTARGSRVLLSCASDANRMDAPAPPPNRLCVWGLRPTKATRASGSCSSTSGDSLAAGAGDPGGVVTGDGVGGLNSSQHLSRFVHPSSSSEPSRILRARLRWLANSTNSACSSAEVSKPG